MSFEITHAPGVYTKWYVTISEPSATHLVESLLEVEQLIADVMSSQAERIAKTVYKLDGREFHLHDGATVEFSWQPHVFDWRCLDCGADTDAIDEYYMVHDSLWQQVVTSYDGQLCIGCFEARLGRNLTAADFTDADVNSTDRLARSARLSDRLTRG